MAIMALGGVLLALAGHANQPNVSCQPVMTSNGTVYIVDSILLPQF